MVRAEITAEEEEELGKKNPVVPADRTAVSSIHLSHSKPFILITKKGTINIIIGTKREITGDAKLYKLINCKKCSDLFKNSSIGQSM